MTVPIITLVFDDPIYIPGTDEFDLTFNDLYFDFITAENGSTDNSKSTTRIY